MNAAAKSLIFTILLGIFTTSAFANCDVCHVKFPQTQNNINLNNNQTFCIESGVFSGNMNINGSNVTICISEGATFSPGNFSFKSGLKIINRGTFNLGGSTVDGAASVENYGVMNVTGNLNFNNNLNLTNQAKGVVTFSQNFELKKSSVFINKGSFIINAEFSSEKTSSFTNEGHLKVKNNFNPGGYFVNNGFVVAQGFININPESNVTNNCTFYSNSGFNNNSNNIFYNFGLIRADGPVQLNGNSSYSQGNRGILVGISLINNSRVIGSGNYYFSGSTTNQAPFGQDGKGINFYDASNSTTRIFDTENQKPHASVTKNVIAAEDTSIISGGCSDNFPVPVATDVVYYSQANKVVYVPLLEIAWDNQVGLNVVATNLLSHDNILRRTAPNGRAAANSFVDEGKGTYYFYPDQSMIEFHPELDYTGVSSIDYFVKNVLGYRSNIASVTIIIDPSPLPVEMTYFNGQLQNKTVELTWGTASEKNNEYFQVERSADGINYEVIGRAEGHGNSVTPVNYQFTDADPLSGVSYYRLLQVDFDGQSEFSKVISVENNVVQSALKVFPNPAQNVLNLNAQKTITSYTVMDIRGAVLKSSVVKNERAVVALNEMDGGIYLVNIQYADNTGETVRFIKN